MFQFAVDWCNRHLEELNQAKEDSKPTLSARKEQLDIHAWRGVLLPLATLVQVSQLSRYKVLYLKEDAVLEAWTRTRGKSTVFGAVSGGMLSPSALCHNLQGKAISNGLYL